MSLEQSAVHPILSKLAGGDRRSIGRAGEVAEAILKDAALFAIVLEGVLHPDPVIRMRAADAAEKASRALPDLLEPHRRFLLYDAAGIDQQEVRWHLSEMLPRLSLDGEELDRAVAILNEHLSDKSKIVRVNALQALAELALRHERLRPEVVERLRRALEAGSPAERSRARRLLKLLEGGKEPGRRKRSSPTNGGQENDV